MKQVIYIFIIFLAIVAVSLTVGATGIFLPVWVQAAGCLAAIATVVASIVYVGKKHGF